MNVQWYLPWMPAVVPQQQTQPQPSPQPQPQMVTAAAQQYMQQHLLKQQQQLMQQQQNYLASAAAQGFLQPANAFFNPAAAGFAATQPQLLAKTPLLRTPQSILTSANPKVRYLISKFKRIQLGEISFAFLSSFRAYFLKGTIQLLMSKNHLDFGSEIRTTHLHYCCVFLQMRRKRRQKGKTDFRKL